MLTNPKHAAKPKRARKSPKDAAAAHRWQQSARRIWCIDRSHVRYLDVPPPPEAYEEWSEWDGAVPPVPPPVDDPLILQIAGLARVPAAGLARLQAGIFEELESAWLWHRERYPEEKPPLPKEIRATRVQLRQLKSLSSELNATIRDLNSSARSCLVNAAINLWCKANKGKDGLPRPPNPSLGADFNQIETMVATLAERASEAVNIASRKRPPNPVGRPGRGGKWFIEPSLRYFTLRLLWDVRAAGGRLTLDKNSRTGTLPEVLKLLSPRLPPGFIPNVLSYPALAEIKALDKKFATPVDVLPHSTLASIKALDKKLATPVDDEPSF